MLTALPTILFNCNELKEAPIAVLRFKINGTKLAAAPHLILFYPLDAEPLSIVVPKQLGNKIIYSPHLVPKLSPWWHIVMLTGKNQVTTVIN